MKKQTLICSAMGIGLLFMLAFAANQDADTAADTLPENEQTWTGDSWPLKTCPVSKREIVNPKTGTYDGREVRFCCGGCKSKFEKDPATYLGPADEEIMEIYRPSYPMKTCIVMHEEPLPTDAEEFTDVVYRNRLVRLCCVRCEKKFNKEPLKYVMALNQKIIEQQGPDYPLTTCVISNKKLDSMGPMVDYVWENQLVRFCCAPCIERFNEDPQKYVKKIMSAYEAKEKTGDETASGS